MSRSGQPSEATQNPKSCNVGAKPRVSTVPSHWTGDMNQRSQHEHQKAKVRRSSPDTVDSASNERSHASIVCSSSQRPILLDTAPSRWSPPGPTVKRASIMGIGSPRSTRNIHARFSRKSSATSQNPQAGAMAALKHETSIREMRPASCASACSITCPYMARQQQQRGKGAASAASVGDKDGKAFLSSITGQRPVDHRHGAVIAS